MIAAVDCLDEAAVLALLAGVGDVSSMDAHLVTCRACRDLVILAARRSQAPVRSTLSAGDPATAQVAGERYELVELLGFGAQGVVYAARDTVLDRKVALKVVRSEIVAHGKILDEARMIAKLSHPHIVAVHDAGATADGALYLTMELVESTLSTWLRGRPPVADILARCIEAGKGLAAAHAAGVVHRDIKPSNILVGRDGHAKVADFGLAMGEPRDSRAIAGTLAYMAPEQLAGRASARADQFAFAVTVWEALTGHLPLDRAAAGAPLVLRPPRDLPKHVTAAVRRALSTEPEHRFPSMDAMVAALAHDRSRTMRRRALAGAAAVAVLATGGFAVSRARSRDATCDAIAGELDGVWDDAARGRVRSAFAELRLPFGDTARTTAIGGLDAYAARWTQARTRACARRHEVSSDVRDGSLECFADRRAALGATARVLAGADRSTVERASEIVAALPDLETCDRPALLRGRFAVGPASRAAVGRVAARTAEATSAWMAGRRGVADQIADRAVVEAEAAAHPPTLALALLTRGKIRGHTGEHAAATEDLKRAVEAAQRGGDDAIAAEAWIELVYTIGYAAGRHDDGLAFGSLAEATLARLGNPAGMRATLDFYRCGVLAQIGRAEDARAACAAARSLRESLEGRDAPSVASVLVLEARLASSEGRFADAHASLERVVAIRRLLGEDHPQLVEAWFTQGQILGREGRFREARERYEQALALATRVMGADSVIVASVWSQLAEVTAREGDGARALAEIDRSIAIYERTGQAHADLGTQLVRRGRMLDDLGRLDEAELTLARALAIFETVHGPDHDKVMASLEDLARVHDKQGKHDLARSEMTRALDIATRSGDKLSIASASSSFAEILHRGKRPREAISYYVRALASFEAVYSPEHPQLYATVFNLGLAHLDLHDTKSAVAYFRRALALEQAATGERSITLFEVLAALADAHDAAGDRSSAAAARERAIALPGATDRFAEEVAKMRAELGRSR